MQLFQLFKLPANACNASQASVPHHYRHHWVGTTRLIATAFLQLRASLHPCLQTATLLQNRCATHSQQILLKCCPRNCAITFMCRRLYVFATQS